MTRFNPTQIANRIGRIVFITILSGVFIGGFTLFNTGEYSSLPSPAEPLSMYLQAGIKLSTTVAIAGLIVPLIVLIYWELSKRVSWKRKWQILLSATVLIATAWTLSDRSGTFNIASEILLRIGYGISILAAISIVEALAGSDIDLNPRQLATGTGALAIVFIFLVPIASITAGVVADPTTDEDRVEAAFDAEDEPYPDYTTLPYGYVSTGESGSADHLFENPTGGRPNLTDEQTYAVSETHIGSEYFDLKTWNVENDSETTAVKGHYYLTFEGEKNFTYDDSIVNSGVADSNIGDAEQPFSYPSVPQDSDGTLVMENTESMWVYYDVATDNGEVHRYMVYLERTDL